MIGIVSRTARALALGLVSLGVLAPAATARVSLVATGTPELMLLVITTRQVAARLALPGLIFGDDGDDRITGDRGRDRIFGGPATTRRSATSTTTGSTADQTA